MRAKHLKERALLDQILPPKVHLASLEAVTCGCTDVPFNNLLILLPCCNCICTYIRNPSLALLCKQAKIKTRWSAMAFKKLIYSRASNLTPCQLHHPMPRDDTLQNRLEECHHDAWGEGAYRASQMQGRMLHNDC